MFKKTMIFLLGLFLSSIFILSSAEAGNVMLSWTASTGDVTGYRIYYGTDPGSYEYNIDVGNITQYNISGLEEGPTYYFVARAYNDAGESENSNQVSWSWSPEDNESPVVTITSPTSDSTHETYESTVSLSGSASDNVGVSQVLWSNLTAGSGGNATGTESWSVSSIALSEGNNSITVTANDESNNQGSKTLNVTYFTSIPDTTPPSGSISINDGAPSTKTLDVTLTFSAGDKESGMGDGAEMKISNDGENWTASMPYSESMSYNLPAGEGTKTVFANFSDAAGNWMLSPVSDQINYMPNQAPVASASANLTSGEAPLAVTFTGTGNDSDGKIASYAWDFGDGATAASQNASHTYNNAGTYTATLTVTDDDGASGSDTVSITVNAPNQAPVASASANVTSGEAPLTVTFTGTGTDSDGSIESYAWDFGDGATAASQNASHTYNTAGIYTATLTVTDNDGATGSDTLSITVNAPNQAPVASASASLTNGEAPLAVTFTGSGTDTDGTIDLYAWDFGDGTTATSQNPSHTYNNAGTYTATLTVTDDDGASGNDSISITVTPKPAATVEDIIIDNGDRQTSYTGRWRESRNSDSYGSRSQYAQYGDATYTWNATFATTGTYDVYMRWTYLYWNKTAVPVEITHSGGVSKVTVDQRSNAGEWFLLGSYNFGTSGTIKVIHDSGYRTTNVDGVKFAWTGSGSTTASTKTISSSNNSPSASASVNFSSGYAPLSVLFAGSGTDSDGTIESYAWDFGDGTTSTSQNPSHTYNNAGTYTATLTVTDDDGASGSDTISIVVSEKTQNAPTAEISTDKTSGTAPLVVNFSGDGSDIDGYIKSFSWDFGDGTTSTSQNPSHTYNTAGTYTATLTVTDDDGASASESIAITVTPKPIATVEDIIIDNGDRQTSYTGRWRESRNSDSYGSRSQYAQYGDATYTWNATFATTGTYDVYMRWTYLYWNKTAVPVEITHSGGVSKVTVDQRSNAGEWFLLGSYNFGTSGTIKVIHDSGYRTTNVDGLKFARTH